MKKVKNFTTLNLALFLQNLVIIKLFLKNILNLKEARQREIQIKNGLEKKEFLIEKYKKIYQPKSKKFENKQPNTFGKLVVIDETGKSLGVFKFARCPKIARKRFRFSRG